jgi:hypothetical protein
MTGSLSVCHLRLAYFSLCLGPATRLTYNADILSVPPPRVLLQPASLAYLVNRRLCKDMIFSPDSFLPDKEFPPPDELSLNRTYHLCADLPVILSIYNTRPQAAGRTSRAHDTWSRIGGSGIHSSGCWCSSCLSSFSSQFSKFTATSRDQDLRVCLCSWYIARGVTTT